MINNKGVGPFGRLVTPNMLELGDVIQISFNGSVFTHSLLVVETNHNNDLNQISIATHSYDSDYRPVSSYIFANIRFIHIEGVRVW